MTPRFLMIFLLLRLTGLAERILMKTLFRSIAGITMIVIDFKGKLITDLHVQGSLTGERITANASLPFPFPF
jgi:hypothetical protein